MFVDIDCSTSLSLFPDVCWFCSGEIDGHNKSGGRLRDYREEEIAVICLSKMFERRIRGREQRQMLL